jgi:hypothetical protein
MTTHLDALRKAFQAQHPQPFAAYCFLLETGSLRIGHSADLGKPNDLDPLLQRPLDLLVCELSHFTPEDLFAYLQGKPIQRIVFIHLNRAYWEQLPAVRKLAAKMLPEIPFTFVRDRETVTL